MSITTNLLLTLTATLSLLGEDVADLCDIVHPDTGVPLSCELHPEGAPVYNDTVCCKDGACFEAKDDSCLADESPYYCELGEVWASNEVTCYVEVPTYCDLFPCAPGYQTQPQANYMCCHAGTCWNTYHGANDCEIQDIYWCDDGVTNQDGTVTCFD